MASPSDADQARIAAFLRVLSVEDGAAPNTLAAYGRDLRAYAGWLAAAQTDLIRADAAHVVRWRKSLIDAAYARSSCNRKLSAVRRLHRFLFLENLRSDDPTALTRLAPTDRPPPDFLSVAEVDALLRAARRSGENADDLARARTTAMLEILYASGLRVSELAGLKVAALRRGREMIRVVGKGGTPRLAPLSPPALQAIAAYLPLRDAAWPKSPYLFPSRGVQGHITRERIFQIIKGLAAQAGLDPARVSPHALRHAFATHLLQNGADLRVIQMLMGHADISATEVYTHVLDATLRRLVLESHPLADKKS